MSLRIGGLFSGSGQLDEAARILFDGEIVWHSEVEPAACTVLERRFPGVPNLGDITQIDWEVIANDESLGRIDILAGGFP